MNPRLIIPEESKSLRKTLKLDGFGFTLLIYGTVGGLVTSYYVPKKKLLFGLGGALTTMYLIDYLVRVVDDKDYNPIPVKYRGKQ
tara:strand:+ start:1120 stop:1374 length:255 start_codon:yes stop_codon:yes gene_type:complete